MKQQFKFQFGHYEVMKANKDHECIRCTANGKPNLTRIRKGQTYLYKRGPSPPGKDYPTHLRFCNRCTPIVLKRIVEEVNILHQLELNKVDGLKKSLTDK